jgi:CNP1-like family
LRPFLEDTNLKATTLAAASLICAAGALLAGCSHTPAAPNKEDSTFTYLLDRKSAWTENKVNKLPPLPREADLLRFDVSQNTPLKFSVDAKSVDVGSDGVVRYTVVVTSPSGAHNVNYEGIRCDTYEWRQYAALNADHDDWDSSVATQWKRIENGELNAYQAALSKDYFCDNKMPAGPAKTIVNNLRFGRTASSMIH